jgi:hypothetical protein
MRHEEAVFIGMEPKEKLKEGDPMESNAITRRRRKLIQDQNEQEYQQALVTLKDKYEWYHRQFG